MPSSMGGGGFGRVLFHVKVVRSIMLSSELRLYWTVNCDFVFLGLVSIPAPNRKKNFLQLECNIVTFLCTALYLTLNIFPPIHTLLFCNALLTRNIFLSELSVTFPLWRIFCKSIANKIFLFYRTHLLHAMPSLYETQNTNGQISRCKDDTILHRVILRTELGFPYARTGD